MPGSPRATSAASATIAHDASSALICCPSRTTINGDCVYSMRVSDPSAASSPSDLAGDPRPGGSSKRPRKLATPPDVNATGTERSCSTTTITSMKNENQ